MNLSLWIRSNAKTLTGFERIRKIQENRKLYFILCKMASSDGPQIMKSLRTMTLQDCHGLLLIILLGGSDRRESHLVHLRCVRATGQQMLQDLHPAVASREVHRAVSGAVDVVQVRLR